VVDTVRGLFGIPAKKLDAISSFSRLLLTRARRNRRLVRADSLESFIGKAQSMRLFDDFDFSWETMPYFHSYARLSHPALKDLGFWRDLPNKLHHRPIWPEVSKPTVTSHIDAAMTEYGATVALGEQEA
jgi:hypothetical protein